MHYQLCSNIGLFFLLHSVNYFIRYVHLLYESWLDASRDISGVLSAPSLSVSAWNRLSPSCDEEYTISSHFVSELLSLQTILDTKDTNFFLRFVIL